MNDWYGVVTGVKFKSHGPVSDPGLIYHGREFNYWDIEDAIYDMYRNDFDPLPDEGDEHFTDWLKENVERIHCYLDEVIAGGYFGEEN